MESMINKNTGVVEPMRIAMGSMGAMGLSRYFAAFSQSILDRYAIWEKYPWSDAVIRYLENEKQEEASQKTELSSFFVTLQLLKIYLTNEREKEKKGRGEQETDHAELTVRIETELRKLKTGYDRYFGILERIYREGTQMPGEELSRIWAILEREAGVRKVQQKNQQTEVRDVRQKYLEADGGPDKSGIAVKVSAALKHKGMTPYALGTAGIRLRHMAEGHAYIPDSKTLFRNSVERQQREFYTKLVRDHAVTGLLLELPAWISRTAARELLRENIRDSGEKEGTWGDSNVYLSELWKRSSQEERKILLRRIPQAVRQAASLWEEADQENGNPGQKEILETMIERIEAAQRGEASQSPEVFRRPEAELSEQEILEEVGRILPELPVWVSETAAWELYSENARGYGTGNEDSETGNAKFQEQQPAVFQDHGESLVYRMENQDSVPAEGRGAKPGETSDFSYSDGRKGNLKLSELWEQSSQEEKKILLHRIPQAVRQASSLWEEADQGNSSPVQKEILETIIERIEATQRIEAARKVEAFQGLEIFRGSETELSEQRIPEEIGRILSELPVWVSETAVLKLHGESAKGLKIRNEDPETGNARFQGQQSAVFQSHGENLVYRMENRDSVPAEERGAKLGETGDFSYSDGRREKLQLTEIWEKASQEERKILLHRIPQAVRQAASLWERTGQGNGGPRQDEILKTIVERIEAVQSFDTIQRIETIQKLSDQRTLKEIEHILSELPAWVSKTAVRELHRKNARDYGAGDEDLETGIGRAERTAAGVFSRRSDGRIENLQLSELWERSSQEEREVLLHRIPQAVRQAASLWEETAVDRVSRLRIEETTSDSSQSEVLKEPLILTALTWQRPRIREFLPNTFFQTSPEIQMNGNSSQFQYTDGGENVIVYAAKTPYSSAVRQNNEEMQVIQGLESRISRQEYVIRQEQIEREELQRRLKKQESRENTLKKSGNLEITSKQGGNLSQNIFSQLKEQLRLERIRYGAD